MASFACLRVLMPETVGGRADLSALVNKFATAFLEKRWAWPRRFEALGPCVYLLIEPRGSALEHGELREMAQDLQLRLFGEKGDGEVSLIAFEGPATEVARFAALTPTDLGHILNGGEYRPPFAGRLARITADDVVAVPLPSPAEAPATEEPGAARPRRRERGPEPIEPVFHGVYFTPREIFVGSAVGPRESRYNLVDGTRPATSEAAIEFDSQSVAAAVQALEEALPDAKGAFFVPLCFGSVIHRAVREQYARFLDALPEARRPQLTAVVYDVPREPSYSVMPGLRDFLRDYFEHIDLQITDPAFAVDKLPAGAANSVTFVLPDGDQATRLAAIRRFSVNRDAYKSRKIWFAITNVRTQAELETCFAQAVPFISGRAVSGPLDRPAGQRGAPAMSLPLRAA